MIQIAFKNLNIFPATMKAYEVQQEEVDEMIRDLQIMDEANANAEEAANDYQAGERIMS